MKYMTYLVAIGLVAFAGCRGSEERISPTGSYPDVKTGNVSEGELVVELKTGPLGGKEVPTLYTVFDANGKEMRESTSASTMLPCGRYLVRLEGAPRKVMTFWVTIEPGRTTHVDVARLEKGEVSTPAVE